MPEKGAAPNMADRVSATFQFNALISRSFLRQGALDPRIGPQVRKLAGQAELAELDSRLRIHSTKIEPWDLFETRLSGFLDHQSDPKVPSKMASQRGSCSAARSLSAQLWLFRPIAQTIQLFFHPLNPLGPQIYSYRAIDLGL